MTPIPVRREFIGSFGEGEVPPVSLESARIVVLPICYESHPSYGAGSGEGPLHILKASEQLEALDEETLIDWTELGIHTLPALFPSASPEAAVAEIRDQALTTLSQQKSLLSLGGDHAISIGLIQAVQARFPQAGILQIDAHLDLRESWNGSRFNHACVMRRAVADLGMPVAQVGIRAVSPEERDFLQESGMRPFFAHEIDPGDDSWIGEVLCALPETVYLSLDLDGLDPSVIPGTGTPEPGGLSYRQVIRLIRALGRNKQVVAADINELVKIPGTQVSEFTAAKIATKIFIHCLANPPIRRP